MLRRQTNQDDEVRSGPEDGDDNEAHDDDAPVSNVGVPNWLTHDLASL
jgi:hypothetical protein